MIVLVGSATGGRLLGGWATGDATTDSGPVSGKSYPEVTGWGNTSVACGVRSS